MCLTWSHYFKNVSKALQLQLLSFSNENKFHLVLGRYISMDIFEDSYSRAELLLLLSTYNFRNMVSHPTRTCLSSSTLVDFFIGNCNSPNVSRGVTVPCISNHLLIHIHPDNREVTDRKRQARKTVGDISDNALPTFRRSIAA